MKERYLVHWGILGMKWGIRRYQNPDGTLTEAGKARYYRTDGSLTDEGRKWQNEERKKRLAHPELMTEEEIDAEIRRMSKEINLKSLMDKTQPKSEKQQKLEEEISMLELEARKKDLTDRKNGKGKYDNKNQNNGGKNQGNNNKDDSLGTMLWRASKQSVSEYVKKNLATNLADRYDRNISPQQRMKDFKNRQYFIEHPEYATDKQLADILKRQSNEAKVAENEEKRKKNINHSAILIHSNSDNRILIRRS